MKTAEEKLKALEEALFDEYESLLSRGGEIYEQYKDSEPDSLDNCTSREQYMSVNKTARVLWDIFTRAEILGDYGEWLDKTSSG